MKTVASLEVRKKLKRMFNRNKKNKRRKKNNKSLSLKVSKMNFKKLEKSLICLEEIVKSCLSKRLKKKKVH